MNSRLASIKRISILTIIVFLGVIIFLNCFLMIKGKEILNSRLSQATGRNIQLEKVWFKLPFSIFIDGVTIDGISPAKEILIKLGFSNVFRSQFVIKRIVLRGADIILIRDQNGKVSLKGFKSSGNDSLISLASPAAALENQTRQPREESKSKLLKNSVEIFIHQTIFENSRLEFVNEKNLNEGDNLKFKQILVEKFNLRIKDFIWPLVSRPIAFHLTGMLSIPDFSLNQKVLKSDGWINFIKKDMKGDLDIAESESESSLHALFVSKDNDMQVSGNIKMSNFMQSLSKEDKGSKGLDQMIFGALSQMGVEVGLDYSFKTKMDQFEITNVSFTGNVVTKPVSPANKAEPVK